MSAGMKIPDWLESMRPPKFIDNDTPRGRESADKRIRIGAIPKQVFSYVEEIINKRLPDLPYFQEFRKEWTKRGPSDVLITGPQGTGKSTLAAWACFREIRRGGQIEWVQAYKMESYLQQRKNLDPRNVLYNAERLPLVVIDDVQKLLGAWANIRMQLAGLIHMRFAVGLPTILCSTMSKAELSVETTHGSAGMLGPDTLDRFPWVHKTEGESLR